MVSLLRVNFLIVNSSVLLFANRKFCDTPYILIVDCGNETAEQGALDVIKSSVDKYIVKSKAVSDSGIELTAEIRVKDDATGFVNRVNEVAGVSGATLVTFNGEYMA